LYEIAAMMKIFSQVQTGIEHSVLIKKLRTINEKHWWMTTLLIYSLFW